MSGLIAKSAITLAAALSTAAASAQSIQFWIGSPPPHEHRQRYGHNPVPRYQPQLSVKNQCQRELFNQARLQVYLPLTEVGFIERRGYGCKISFNNNGVARVSGSYDLYKNPYALEHAKDRAFKQEDTKRQQRYRQTWPRGW